MSTRSGRLGLVCWNLAWVLLVLAGGEFALSLLLNHPPGSGGILVPMREYYVAADRNIVQFLPECAQWDETLGYILRPGKCRFANREFSTNVEINSAGLRDDEASLQSPEIIVIGDSHAMGWGVENSDCFSEIVERMSGRRVLNAAVSSYGTVRELTILNRLDTSNLDWLIIQYCPNDVNENSKYDSQNPGIETMSYERYLELVAENAEHSRYSPGKYMRKLLPLLVRYLFRAATDAGFHDSSPTDARREARLFLDVLQGPWNLPIGTRLIVLEVNKLALNDSLFVDALREEIRVNDYPRFVKEMTIIDLSEELKRDDYFAYDGHMCTRGHQVIAEKVHEVIGGSPAVPAPG